VCELAMNGDSSTLRRFRLLIRGHGRQRSETTFRCQMHGLRLSGVQRINHLVSEVDVKARFPAIRAVVWLTGARCLCDAKWFARVSRGAREAGPGMKQEATPEQDVAVGHITAAAEDAKEKSCDDLGLDAVGRCAFDVATKIGSSVRADGLTGVLK
jgi:hypothetical protein